MRCCDALDKYCADPARDAQRLPELKLQEQRCLASGCRTQSRPIRPHAGFRWLLEELGVSFFAQELRTPQPVSIKRQEKAWTQLNH
jgi:ATP-dependent helicase HrpA